MEFFGHEWTFWVALIGTAIVKVIASPFSSVWKALATFFISIFIAWLFADPVVDYLSLDPATYQAPMAGLIALTAEGLVRAILSWATHPESILAAIFKKVPKGDE